jgi:enterochelin esterase-like enzyme
LHTCRSRSSGVPFIVYALTTALLTVAVLAPASAAAQAQRPPAFVRSPEVNPDRTITFRVFAPGAHLVSVGGDMIQDQPRRPMTRDSAGVWSVTLGPFAPDIYDYTYQIDDLVVADPANPSLTLGPRGAQSLIEVPGDSAELWDARRVPHGTVHIDWYHSNVIGGLRAVYVYTPPGYEGGSQRYPVLYLLHGAAFTQEGWTTTGRANFILDNLIAEGKARPMVVVMPYGYPQPATTIGLNEPMRRDRSLFAQDLIQTVIPLIERTYRVDSDADHRAIAGFSMGGNQSLTIGLTHPAFFHWVAGFSAAIPRRQSVQEETFAEVLDHPDRTNRTLKLLWTACGTDDRAWFPPNKAFAELLDARGVHHTFVTTPGAHQWQVWRRNLIALAPLLFAR